MLIKISVRDHQVLIGVVGMEESVVVAVGEYVGQREPSRLQAGV